jgi:flagellin
MATVDVTRIASNIQALNALNSLQGINAKLALHQQRLSTGKRINSASDDPAGLTIATKMMARSEGLKASIDNISDAKNMLSVAEGGLSTMTDIMIAMRTQAEKAASDTLGTAERATIQTQLSSYAQQIQDLVDQTKWNGVKLLDNTTGAKVFQTGVDEGETTSWSIPQALVPGPTGLNLSKRVASATATSVGTAASFQTIAVGVPVQAVSTAVNLSELSTGDYTLNVIDKAVSATQGTTILDMNSTLIGGMTSLTGYSMVTASATTTSTMTSGRYELKIISTSALSTTYELKNLTDTTWNGVGKLTATTTVGAGATTINLTDASGTATRDLGVTLNLSGSGGAASLSTGQVMSFEFIAQNQAKLELRDSIGTALNVSQYKFDATTIAGSGTTGYADTGATWNSGRAIQAKLHSTFSNITNSANGGIQNFTYEKMSNYSVNVSNTSRAGAYLTTVTSALDRVTSTLSDLGALISRLTYKETQSATAQVAVEGAYSRIMNANMAEEQVNASKYTILQQTATAMLAQANAAPQSLLALFR